MLAFDRNETLVRLRPHQRGRLEKSWRRSTEDLPQTTGQFRAMIKRSSGRAEA
jgi:hypothetical protein